MLKDRAAGRKAFFALLVFCQLGFVLAAAFPGIRLCHRTDGRAVLETATPFGCSCEECEHCLERLLNPDPDRAARVAYVPCHCRHERSLSESASSSGLVPRRKAVIPPAIFIAAVELPGLPGPEPGTAMTGFLAREFVFGPAGPSLLRC